MKFLNRKKQHETILMLASIIFYAQTIASYTQNSDVTMHLDEIYNIILNIALNVSGSKGKMELVDITEALNRQADQMVEIFNMTSSNSIGKDDNNDGLPN